MYKKSETNEKLKQAVLFIISKCEDKPTFGLKVLHKLLYFADFNFYKNHHQFITQSEYMRYTYGPFIKGLDRLLKILEDNKEIHQEQKMLSTEVFQNRFKLLVKPQFTLLNGDEINEIDKVIKNLGDLNGNQIEEVSHNDIPWQVSEDSEIIDPDLVFYRDEEMIKRVE